MNKLQYHACGGRAVDIEAMERMTYYEFCSILDNYLEKCKIEKEQMDKLLAKHGNRNK